MDIVQSASTMNRLRYQATGLSWEREAEGGATSEFDTTVGTPLNDLKVEIKYTQDLHGYDNPWPAGGGKNLLDPNTMVEYGSGNGRRWYQTDGFTLNAEQPYTFSVSGTNQLIIVYIVDESTAQSITYGTNFVSYTPEEDTLVYFQAYEATGIQEGNNFQLELGTTATSYEPYENECPIIGYNEAEIYLEHAYDAEADPRYTIDLDGTRYSGTLDVTTGEMVLDLACTELDETWYWYIVTAQPADGTVCATAGFPDHIGQTGNDKCSHYFTPTRPYITDMTYGTFLLSLTGTGAYFNFKNESGGTVQEFKDYIVSQRTAGTPIQVMYELPEPITVQLDPTTVTALTGHNVIWCNTGNVISVDYNIT